MPAPTPALPKRVLIIDRSADSRDVFRTVLERRGLEILEATEFRAGLDAIRQFHPQVVVMDLESTEEHSAAARRLLSSELADCDSRFVLLGAWADGGTAENHLVRKPYRYGPLVRKIEQLADQSPLRPSGP